MHTDSRWSYVDWEIIQWVMTTFFGNCDQITRLQQIQNSLACAVVKAPKSSHIIPILRSLHWLEITECIEYKLVSLTYKVLTTIQLSYLHNLIAVQPPRSTQSSFLVTLARPSTSSSLRITDHSFHYASPGLWNELPASLCQPRTDIQLSNFDSASSMSGTSSIGFIDSPLSSSIDSPLSSSVTPSLFHSRLKTFLFTARCYASAVLAMALCLSVCPFVTSRCSTKTTKHSITQITPHDSPGTLVFWHQRSPRNSTGDTPYGGTKCR